MDNQDKAEQLLAQNRWLFTAVIISAILLVGYGFVTGFVNAVRGNATSPHASQPNAPAPR